jgi:predicted small secreted protein
MRCFVGEVDKVEFPLERSTNMKRIVAVLLAVAFLSIATVGCHTVKGAGKDIQRGGRAVENAAEDVRTSK